MKFNAKKCYSMRIHKRKNPITHSYTMGEEDISTFSTQSYLGIELHKRLSWKPHIGAVGSKVGKTLGFTEKPWEVLI